MRTQRRNFRENHSGRPRKRHGSIQPKFAIKLERSPLIKLTLNARSHVEQCLPHSDPKESVSFKATGPHKDRSPSHNTGGEITQAQQQWASCLRCSHVIYLLEPRRSPVDVGIGSRTKRCARVALLLSLDNLSRGGGMRRDLVSADLTSVRLLSSTLPDYRPYAEGGLAFYSVLLAPNAIRYGKPCTREYPFEPADPGLHETVERINYANVKHHEIHNCSNINCMLN